MDTTWNPDLYLKFQKERTQPSFDLVGRIELEEPESIIDIGCGPGTSTRVLWERWPGAAVTGLDSSPEMIEKARGEYPDRDWRHADVRDLAPEPKFDLVYSNATIQWIPDHETLVPQLFGLVDAGGALAVQIPLYREMPVSTIIASVAERDRWRERTEGCDARFTFHCMDIYYDILAGLTPKVSMWQTWYVHEMQSHELIVEMMSSTGMRQFLERLESGEDKKAFADQVLDGVREAYPAQKNGVVLYPFKRLFFVAYA